MIIYRAGLTGCLAAIMNPDATVIDEDKEPFFHKAVLRFRSDEISKATGIPFKKIKVTKALFDDVNHEFINPDFYYTNSYSLKVVGGVYNRSIDSLDPVTRWLAPDNFHEQLIEMIGDRIAWGVKYDPAHQSKIVSTLAMPKLFELLDTTFEFDTSTHFNEIFVTTIKITIDCDVHQTVYFPILSSDSPFYRATLEGQKLILESTREVSLDEFEDIPNDVFGLEDGWEVTDLNYHQKIGKIAPIDEELRKDAIYTITQQHGIYSLGRTATWRNILLDDCLQDIKQINAMISKSKYERMLGK